MPHCPICFEGDDGNDDDDTDKNERDEGVDEGREGGGVGDEGGDDPRETKTSTVTPTKKKKEKKEKFLVRGKYCSHGFCRPCVERVLLVSSSEPQEVPIHARREPFGGGISGQEFVASLSQPKHPSNVAIKGVPTQGCCPLCRARLSLFDLTWVESSSNDEADGNVAKEVKKEVKTETKKKQKGTKKKADKGEDAKDDDKDEDPSRYAYGDEIITDWRQTPLVGKVYANMTGVGRFSFHFTENRRSVGGANANRAPHVNVEEILRDAGNPPNRVASSKLPIRHFQWHVPSRTMRATIINTLSRNSEHDELIMCFSKNLAFLRAGARISHWKAPPSPQVMHRMFPFDGVYHTSLVDQNGNPLNNNDGDNDILPTIKSVLVQAHKFVRDQQAYSVRTYPDQNTVFLVCPAHLELSLKGSWNFAQQPGGPRQGDSLVVCPAGRGWFEKWTVADKSAGPPPSEVVYMGLLTTEVAGRYRLRTSSASSSSASLPVVVPKYHGDTLPGNVFCQSDTVGLASYHFSGPDDIDHNGIGTLRLDDREAPQRRDISAYISYESPQVSRWPPLDDGTRPPAKVEFRDATYDASTRTFRGSIHWLDDYGTSWQQMNKWDYVMNFDTELTCIVGGNVMGHGGAAVAEYNGDGTARAEGREIARFGENLVYTNAALDEYFRAASREGDSAAATGASPSASEGPLLRRSEAFRERLRNEGASVRTIAAVHTKWAGSQSS